MKIAIHNSETGFHPRWISYCKSKSIDYKLVNCYDSNIIKQLNDCNALMWHHSHTKPEDILFAKQLLFSIQYSGIIAFPDFSTNWHFDDKIGQKYLFEVLEVPFIPTYIFYNKENAIKWTMKTSFPKIFKLRAGSASCNVKLVKNRNQALKLIKQSFGKGFTQFDSVSSLKERFRKYRLGENSLLDLMKGIIRLFYHPIYSKNAGIERGYVYFQDFLPNNTYDLRVIVIAGRAFGIKRLVRKNDFRASGSGDMIYERNQIDERCIKIAFKTNKELKSKCVAYDFIFDNNKPLISEISYGFPTGSFHDPCPGYWDEKLNWIPGNFNPQEWMVEHVINLIKLKNN